MRVPRALPEPEGAGALTEVAPSAAGVGATGVGGAEVLGVEVLGVGVFMSAVLVVAGSTTHRSRESAGSYPASGTQLGAGSPSGPTWQGHMGNPRSEVE